MSRFPTTNRRSFLASALAAGAYASLAGGRPEGFVLTNERLGEKVVVHNYGHGGGGVSLSWGVALLAAEQARNLEDKTVAVIGSGVVGLSTARVLQRRGKAVTLYTRELPPETTPNVAGALWYPTHVYDPQKVSNTFLERYG